VVGAVTTAWDAAHAVVSVMGDRFVLIRSDSTVGRSRAGMQAVRNTGTETAMRPELAAAVAGLISHAEITDYKLTEDETRRLVAAADIVTYARTAVERDYRGDVIDSHAPEMPTRFVKQTGTVGARQSRHRHEPPSRHAAGATLRPRQHSAVAASISYWLSPPTSAPAPST